jgi:hypothetical protein
MSNNKRHCAKNEEPINSIGMCSPSGRGQMLVDKRLQGINADAAAAIASCGPAAAVGIL